VNGNIIGEASSSSERVALDITSVLETALANNGGPIKTHALVVGGLAVDAGDNDTIGGTAFDQRGPGFLCIFGARVDIGAVEVGLTDTTPPRVTISSSTKSVMEDALTPIVFTIFRESSAGSLTVHLNRTGTATLDDFSSTTLDSVSFADGVTSVFVTVTPTPDTTVEENETINFTIIPGAGYRW
jgi:hypothetical protein